jgi:hypothetical protein
MSWASLQVSKHFSEPLDPAKRYIFAYMPHGMLPAGMVYMSFLPSWSAAFPGVLPVPLTASVIHWVPMLREAVQWLGGRVVRLTSVLERSRHGSSTCWRFRTILRACSLRSL